MTNEELSNSFTTLLNSYGSIADFGEQASQREIVLDEYEKSVFLTEAQDIIVKSYHDRGMNQQGQGFDDSARRQADFSSLIRVVELSPTSPGTATLFDTRSIFFQLPTTFAANQPEPVLIIENEKLLLMAGNTISKEYVVKPIANTEYDREMSKPYNKPLKKQAWRLFQNKNAGFDIWTEIIPRETAGTGKTWKYRVRYIRRPKPIILEDLTDTGLSIDEMTAKTECELNPILHMDILHKAVELAYASRGGRVAPDNRNNQQQR